MYNLIMSILTITISTVSGSMLAIVLYRDEDINLGHITVFVICLLLIIYTIYMLLRGEKTKDDADV